MCKQTIEVRSTSRGVRVWIEGPRMTEHGFITGSRYDRTLVNGVITYTLTADGRYGVSKKKEHGCIDYSAKAIEGLVVGQSLSVNYSDGVITIQGEQS